MKPVIRNINIERMNNTEHKFEKEYLYPRKLAGEIVSYEFEKIKLRLADRTFYTPDFFVTYPNYFEFIEVKGFWRDDARVKIKVATEQYHHFKWRAVQWKNKQWVFEEF